MTDPCTNCNDVHCCPEHSASCYAECVEKLSKALETLVSEGECYCVVECTAKGPCGHCAAKTLLAEKDTWS